MLRALGEYTIVNVSDGQNGTPGSEGPQGEKGDDGSSFHWNILKNTDDLTKWSRESGVTCTSSNDGWYKVTDNTHTSSRWGIYQNVSVAPSTTYSISVWAKNEARLSVSFVDTVGWGSEVGYSGSGEALLKYTFTTTAECSTVRVYLNFYPTASLKECYFKRPKLEIGKTISDWCGTYEEQHGASAEAVVEYALVLDGGDISSATWSTIVPEFLVGYSYWRRVRTIWSDGRLDTFSTPQRDDVLTGAMKGYSQFTFQMSISTYTRNLRNESGSTVVQFLPRISGYGPIIPVFTVDGTEISSTTYTISHSDKRLSIRISMKAEYLGTTLVADTQELKCIDETTPAYYLGAHKTAPTNANGMKLLPGDWYFSTVDKKTYVYTESKNWRSIVVGDENFAEMALSTLPDKFESASSVTDELLAENIYVKNLISSFVTAAYIAAKDIELLDGGIVRSKGYSKGTVKKLINGETLPTASPEKGFYMDTQGDAEFYKADMYEVNVSKGKLSEVTVSGELKSETFTTQKEDVLSSEHSNIPITEGVGYWDEAAVIAALSSYSSASVHSLTGSYAGTSYTKAIKLSEAERTTRRYFIDTNADGSATAVTPAVKLAVRFEGSPGEYSYTSIHGEKVLEGLLEYYDGSSWKSFSSTITIDVAPGKTVGMRGLKPAVPDEAVVFKNRVNILSETGLYGHVIATPYYASQGCSCILVTDDGMKRLCFNAGATQVATNNEISSPYQGSYSGSAFGNRRLVTLDALSTIRTLVSNYGSNPSPYTASIGDSSSTWRTILFMDGYFYAFSYNNSSGAITHVARSEYGTSWTEISNSSFGVKSTMRDFVQVGTYLYAIDGGSVVRTSNLGYFETLVTFSFSTPSHAHLSYAESTFLLTDGNVLRASKDGVTWYRPNDYANIISVLPLAGPICLREKVSGFEAYTCCMKAEKITQSDFTVNYSTSRKKRVSYDYTILNEGWNFIDSSGVKVGSISISSPQMVPKSTAFSIASGSSTLFSSSSTTLWYRFRGLRKKSGSSYVTVASGIIGRIDASTSKTFTYTRKGESAKSVAASSIKSIAWDSTGLTINTSSGTLNFSSTDWLSAFSLTIVPVGRSRGNYTEGIFPESGASERTSDIDIGRVDNKFNNMYATTFHGALDGNASTASKASIVIDAGDGRSLTLSYSKAGLSSNPSWVAAWSGNELRAVAPSVLSVGYAASAGSASKADSATKANSADIATKASSADSATKATSADSATKAYWS